MIENNDGLVLGLRNLNNLLDSVEMADDPQDIASLLDDMHSLLEEIRSYTGY